MSKWILLLHFLSLLFLCVSPSSFSTTNDPVVSCSPHQVQAFTQFKNEFDTPHCNHNDNFNGVWCDNSTGAVTKLQLRSCLSGTLKSNSSLFRFHQLRYLNLSHNNLSSTFLPSEFGNLNKLEVLSLSFNGLLGQVPSSFSNLTMLSQLVLSHNDLTGSFPLVWNLSNLLVLDLSRNHFSGTLDPNSGLFTLHRLRRLHLSRNNFTSSLPSNLGNLNKLEHLSLASNGFCGQVPHALSNLTQLSNLFLGRNKLTGSFPLVGNLSKLSALGLPLNFFTGTIPSSIFTMPFLSSLDLRGNNLSGSIEVPNSTSSSRLELFLLGSNHFGENILKPISKLITLKYLDISYLNTSYPIDLSLLSSLKYLLEIDLSGNNISPSSLRSDSNILPSLELLGLSRCNIAEFPNMIKTLQNLVGIELSNNLIKGKVPEWLWKLPRLSIFSIRNNSFTGFEGSKKVLVNSSLNIIDLGGNDFEGTIPILPLSVSILNAQNNRFTGEIPLTICNRSSLTDLDLSNNNFIGPIPQCLTNFVYVVLRKNNLEGSIPDMFYVGSSLWTLDVGHNRLTGKLPRSLLNCSRLEFLSVDNNLIKDVFPFWLKALPNLQILTLRSNKFSGSISPYDQGPLGFLELRVLDISDNNFTGSLSSSYFVNWKAASVTMNEDGGLYMVYTRRPYGKVVYTFIDDLDLKYKGLSIRAGVLTSYSAIDFSGNRIKGKIPESIGLLKGLIALNLSNNAFTGHIPSSFGNVTKLESLDLSRNQLSGTIPNELEDLSFLAYINVSHNNLKGEIPQGTQITGQSKSSFEDNAGLCGLPLEESCFGTRSPPTQLTKEEDKEEEEEVLSWKGVAIGYGFGVLFGLGIAQVTASYK